MEIRTYKDDHPDAPAHEVHIFGRLEVEEETLVFYRMVTHYMQTSIGSIELLPILEFEERFKKFKK